MSKATKFKHVAREVLDEFPEPEGDQKIVKVIQARGGNQHEVELDDGTTMLVQMPTKYRSRVWIKRGDYLIVEPIQGSTKIGADIAYVLYNDQIKHLKKQNLWPARFLEENSKKDDSSTKDEEEEEGEEGAGGEEEGNEEEYSEEEDDDDLFVNTNRQMPSDSDDE
eukprot:Colp12_sorted_trinity150504_noHs@21157